MFECASTFIPKRPGMYVELTSSSDTKQTVAIVGVDGCEFHFLVKNDEKSQFLDDLACGKSYATSEEWVIGPAEVDMSHPQGGFDTSDVRGREVICFAGGSGIAGILPVLIDLKTHNDAMSVKVYYSETANTFAYSQDIDLLKYDTVRFVTEGAMSANPQEPILGMIAKLTGSAPIVFPHRPIVYVCGGLAYTERLKEALVPVYVQEEDFRLNF